MIRRTPLLALVLAPIVLIAVALLWQSALGPLVRSVWYGATAVQWRLDSSDAQTREQALLQAVALRPTEAKLIAKVTAMTGDDPAPFSTPRCARSASLGRASRCPKQHARR